MGSDVLKPEINDLFLKTLGTKLSATRLDPSGRSLFDRLAVYGVSSCASTMDLAESLRKHGEQNLSRAVVPGSGTQANGDAAVFSLEQTAGRGRASRKWYSATGEGLYVTYLLHSSVSGEMLLGFSLAMGLAVHSMLQHFAVSAALKWPNDVLAKGKGQDYGKICGILIENTACADGKQALRIGVGLNINQKAFPSEVPGISMRQALGKQVDYLSVFCELSAQVVLHAEIMFSDGFSALREKWFGNSMMNNARVKFSGGAPEGCCRWGRVMDIATDGALIVTLEHAGKGTETVKIYSGEVELDNAIGN